MIYISGMQGEVQSAIDPLESQANSLGCKTFCLHSLPDDVQVEEFIEMSQSKNCLRKLRRRACI